MTQQFITEVVFAAVDKTSPAIRRINAAVRRQERTLRTATTRLYRYAQANRKAIDSAGRWAALRITAPLTLAAGASLKAAASMEQYSIALNTMTGNAERGKMVLDDLISFASRTPFQTENIVAAGKRLLGFQVDAEKLIPTLTQLGDLASGTGVSIGELAQIYGKAFGKQKLQAEELNQLAERGIPIMATLVRLAEESGKTLTTADIYKMASEGKITFSDFARALDELTRKGGKFYNLTEKQSQSLGGLFSTTTSKIWEIGAATGGVLDNIYNIKENLRGLNEWLDGAKASITSADAATQAWTAHFAVGATTFAPLLIGLAAILAVLGAIGTKAFIASGLILGTIAAAKEAYDHFNPTVNSDAVVKIAQQRTPTQNFAAARTLRQVAERQEARHAISKAIEGGWGDWQNLMKTNPVARYLARTQQRGEIDAADQFTLDEVGLNLHALPSEVNAAADIEAAAGRRDYDFSDDRAQRSRVIILRDATSKGIRMQGVAGMDEGYLPGLAGVRVEQ